MENEKAKSLIGRKVRGFEYSLMSVKSMFDYIGKTGEIIMGNVSDYKVRFDDGQCWFYPKDEIEAHLVEEGVSENELNKVDSILTEIEQLKADKEELVNVLDRLTANFGLIKLVHENPKSSLEYSYNEAKQTLEKHGKSYNMSS